MADPLRALGNETRRDILRLVWDRELPASEIARRMELSAPAASQHLRALREADLVAVRVDRNRRLYSVRHDTFDELRTFFESFWTGGMASLKRAAEDLHGERKRGRRR
ncbi:MAG: ArsR/SmtB family transcription factor [Actinomycetota bacterium]